MMLFRSAVANDLEAIHHLANHSGVGITTLSKDINVLKERLTKSVASFSKLVNSPGDEDYLFVLEDAESAKVVGISAIKATVGFDAPFYSYKLSKRTRMCYSLKIRNDYEVLSLVNDNQEHSEICTLFLDPSFRRNANGLLLSRSRFLFIGQFPKRFAPIIIAEMRGISDEAGNSPFWDHVCSHFFHMSFAEADNLTLSTNKQFIADLMPRNAIYVKLINPQAQAVIGQPHHSTVPAMRILLKEGFRYNKYVDIFDAGPTIEAPQNSIRSIVNSKLLTIKNTLDEVGSKRFIVANTNLDFRTIISQVLINEQHDTCMISHEAAKLLQVKIGDYLRVTAL